MAAPAGHVYNCKIVKRPLSDLVLKALPTLAAGLPAKVDLRPNMPPVYDQGSLGSCTANALCGAYQYDAPGHRPSRLFVYYNERAAEGTVATDAGAELYDGVASLKKYGVCEEEDWPYVEAMFSVKPPAACYTSALKAQVLVAANIPDTLAGMKQSLALSFPFVVGFVVYESFESPGVAATGMMPMPQPGEKVLGGHAVLVVGYDDSMSRFIVRNSWGEGWGDKGYFYMPYDFLCDPHNASDLWNITSVEGPVAPAPARCRFPRCW
jgi:C1A family cysteine protease